MPSVCALLAGMPAPFVLTDLTQMRIQAISFFMLAFLICSNLVLWLWNGERSSFSRLPLIRCGKPVSLIYALLLIAGSHLFLRWLYREMKGANDASNRDTWKWRWTLSGFSIVVLMFAAGIAVTGVAHQVTWMSRSGEPLYRKGSARYRL